MKFTAKLSLSEADECLANITLYGARAGLDALEAKLGIKPSSTVKVPVSAADCTAARTKVANHLIAPDYAAPYDLMQSMHNRMEFSTLLGQAIRPGPGPRPRPQRSSALAARARSSLNLPFAAIDAVTLRGFYKNQAAGAKAPWQTWALPIAVPVWLVAQAAACVGALAKGALLVTATAVRLGMFAGSCLMRGTSRTVDSLQGFVLQQAAVQTLRSATAAGEDQGMAGVREELVLMLASAKAIMGAMLDGYITDALKAGSSTEDLHAARAVSVRMSNAWAKLDHNIEGHKKSGSLKDMYADCIDAVPVDVLLDGARKFETLSAAAARSQNRASKEQLGAARRALGAAAAVLQENTLVATQLAEDLELSAELQQARAEGRYVLEGLMAML